MSQEPSGEQLLRFGSFTLDPRSGELLKNDRPIKLPPQPFKVLALLASRPGMVVGREEIQRELWSDDTFVDFEHGIHYCINQIRSALGDDPQKPRYVQTLPRRGYRFVATVETDSTEPTGVAKTPSPRAVRKGVLTLVGVLVVVLAVVVGFNVGGLRERLTGEPSTGPIQSLAVLPLENLSGDPEQEYFADGMTEALIGDLAKIGALKVISRTSVMRYKDTDKSLPEIARELNVDAVVEGSVMRAGDRVRITAQLIHAATERHLWAESYERDLTSILGLQGEVARAIAEQIRIAISPEDETRLANAPPRDTRSLRKLSKGNTCLGGSPTGLVGRGGGVIRKSNRARSELRPGLWKARRGTRRLCCYWQTSPRGGVRPS